MVMAQETAPSPQCVGLEFVRQYYTVLNKAPAFLHRFYNQDSKLIHADGRKNKESKDVVSGQNEIHEKIMSLRFNDCHAKIREVDAFTTIGNGILIAVSGELSNNRGPMRKFSQSIVLAPQAARKYYVHSDIFKYLDDVFEDHSSDESESEGEVPVSTQPQEDFTAATINGSVHVEEEPSPVHASHITLQQPPSPPSQPVAADPPPASQIPPPTVSPIPPAAPIAVEPPQSESPPVDEEWSVDSPPAEEQEHSIETDKSGMVEETKPEPPSNEPKTYANLLKKTSGNPAPAPYPGPDPPITNHQPPKPPRSSEPTRPPRNFGGNDTGFGPKGPRGGFGGGDFEDRKRIIVPDSQQVFVGNLPHSITEEELKDTFSKFGKVVDIRINTAKGKTSIKGTVHTVPNFGFISFDSEEAVAHCLESRPMFLHDDSRINVEEKKARTTRMDGPGSGPPPSRGRGGMPRGSMSRGGPRGGFNRDRGAPRGGFGGRR